MANVRQPPENWFWPRVRVTNGCWEWTGAKNHYGYGQVPVRWHTKLAHRVSFELAYGPIPSGLIIRHGCDNRTCVNPQHLSLGSHLDNAHDRESRGRGRRHHGHVLTACKKGGHPLTPENVVPRGNSRQCRICKNEYQNAYKKRRLLAQQAVR